MDSAKQKFSKDAIPATVVEEEEPELPDVPAGDTCRTRSRGSLSVHDTAEGDPLTISASDTIESDPHPLSSSPSGRNQEHRLSPKQSNLLCTENTENSGPAHLTVSTSKLDTASPSCSSSPSKSELKSTTPTKLSKLKRSLSSQSLLKSAFSPTRLLKKSIRSRDPSPSRSSGHGRAVSYGPVSGQPFTGVDSPNVQRMFKRDSIPDLDSVNRALEALKHNPDQSKRADDYNKGLTEVADELRRASQVSKRLLNEAMEDRERGDVERCRSKCINIVHSKHADLEAKVFAYNILSTQASPGQAQTYLNDAEKLIWKNVREKPELERLMGVVRSLRESAKVRDANGEKYGGGKEKDAPSSEGNGGWDR